MKKVYTVLISIGIVSCICLKINAFKIHSCDTIAKIQKDTIHLPNTGEMYKKSPIQIEEERQQDIADSINLVRTLELALRIANKNKEKSSFNIKTNTLSIRYGNIFSSSQKHLIVIRNLAQTINTDIYKLLNNEFVKVISNEINPLAYVGDTIQDVNGDNLLDYLFHWYPMSGCCLRDIYDVYLQKPNGEFEEKVEFVNPSFSVKEKTVRGLCYGWTAPLYKFKWNGYKVDTVEYIYLPDSINENHFIRRKHLDKTEKGEVILQLPDEYKTIVQDNNYKND